MMTGDNSYDLTNLRKSIVSLVKNAQNGLRLLRDLRTELEFTDTYRAKVNFTSAVRKLERMGYVERVFVFKPENPDRKYYCIKYIKDLPVDDEADDSEVEEGEFNDDFSGDEGDGTQNAEETKSDADLQDLSSMNLVQSSPSVKSRARILFNQYYPLEAQVFHLIERSSVQGVPGVEVTYKLTGSTYLRILTRMFNLLVGNGTLPPAKMNKYLNSPLGYLVVIRGVDFNARMKFYRYFSNLSYTEFSKTDQHPSWGTFWHVGAAASQTLIKLNQKCYVSIPGRASVHNYEDGTFEVIYFGEVGKMRASGIPIAIPTHTSGKKLGRPRLKDADGGDLAGDTPSKKPKKAPKTPKAKKTPKTKTPKAKTPKGKAPIGLPEPDANIVLPIDDSDVTTLLDSSQLDHSQLDPSLTDPMIVVESVGSEFLTHISLTKRKEPPTLIASETPTKRPKRGVLTNQTATKTTSTNLKQSSIDSFFAGGQPKSRDNSTLPESVPPGSDLLEAKISNGIIENVENGHMPMEVDIAPEEQMTAQQENVDVVETETNISQAIEAISEQVNETAADPGTPVPELNGNSKDNDVAVSHKISIVMLKRVDQILQLLNSNNGIMQGGVRLVHALNAKFSKENGSLIDKKTVVKVIIHLEKTGEIRQIFVPTTNTKLGLQFPKSLLISKNIDKDDPIIEQKKQELINEVRDVVYLPQIKTEENNFKVYAEKIKAIERERVAMREQKKREREARRRKPEQRLAHKDRERREAQKREREAQKREAQRRYAAKMREINKKATAARRKSGRASDANQERPVQTRRRTRGMGGDDPLFSLPLADRDLQNSKRIAKAREQDVDRPKKGFTVRAAKKNGTLSISPDMFFRIVIISRTLFPGLTIINWDKVAGAIPGISAEQAKSMWPQIRDSFGKGKTINLIMRGWEKIFLQAYEDGEIRVFRDGNYDLAYLARFWTSKYPSIHEQSEVPFLFDDPKDNEALFTFKDPEYDLSQQDAFFTMPSMVKLQSALVRWPMAYAKTPVEPVLSPLLKAKIAIKAIIATTNADYDLVKATKVLQSLEDSTALMATRELDQEKTIVYVPPNLHEQQASPGRQFLFSENFMSSLHQRLGHTGFYEVNRFYDELLTTLNASKGYIMARMIPNATLPCVLDMIGYQKVDLVRVNTLDHVGGVSHNSRLLDKNKFECDIVVRTPLRYVESGDKTVVPRVSRPDTTSNTASEDHTAGSSPSSDATFSAEKANPVPLGEPCSTIWSGVNGSLSHPIFRKLVHWILMYIDSRPGVGLNSLYAHIQVVLSPDEIGILLGWLTRQRCIRKGPYDGYWVEPEWYANIGVS